MTSQLRRPTADHVTSFLHHLEHERHHAAASIVRHRQELLQLVRREVPLEPEALARFVTTREDGTPLAPTSRNRRRSLVRAFVAFLVRQGLLDGDPSAGIGRARVPIEFRAALGVPDLDVLLAAVRKGRRTWRRARNEAILLVLFQTGLRLHELVSLNLEQVDLVSAFLLDVRRKGGAAVDVPLNVQARTALASWLAVRPGTAEVAVFVGGPRVRRLSTRGVQKVLADLGARAGQRRRVHPHALRHAHATALLRAGVSTELIRQSLSHSSIRTTQRYLHGDAELLRAALARMPELGSGTAETPPPEA